MENDNASTENIKKIADRLEYLETVARDTASRLYAIETRLGLGYGGAAQRPAQARQPQQPAAPPAKPPLAVKPPVPPTVTRGADPARRSAETPPQEPRIAETLRPPSATQSQPQAPSLPTVTGARIPTRLRGDLEARIGGNWFNRIGIIAICFGVAFFLKYAFDNEWIGPGGRVLIGVAIGLGFLAAGERLRKNYAGYAYGLTGGGLAILYLAIWFASQNRYNLIPQMLAFILMAAVTATGSLLAARYDALPIAVLALIGGFLTPILLSTGVDNETGLFGYIALLDAGVLALAYSKQWRSLNYVAFVGTVLMFGAWMDQWYEPEKLWTTIFFLTLFFVIFALLAVLYNVVNKRLTTWPDLALVFSNALLYFGTSYELLDENHQSVLGVFAILVSGFYLALGYFTNRRDREDTLLIYTFIGLAVVFAVLAVPIQFDQHWVTIAWALEGGVLTLIGLKAADRTSRYGALLVFAISVSHWLIVDVQDFAYGSSSTFVPLLNRRALSGGVLVAALAAAAFFYKRYGKAVEESERTTLAGLYVLGANLLAIFLLSIDANDYFEQARSRRLGTASGNEAVGRLIDGHRLTLTALWAIYGAALLIAGIARRLKALRVVALLLLGLTTIKVLVADSRHYDASWHFLVLNSTFAAFALVIAALVVGAWYYWQAAEIDESERRFVATALILVANLLALIALSAEALGYFDRGLAVARGPAAEELENTKWLTLSVLWSIYATIALAIGIKRDAKLIRWGALLLLTITGAKVLVIDLAYYDAEWHRLVFNQTFSAFAILVAALACGVSFYARAGRVPEPERTTAVKSLMAVANLFAIIGLSAEAVGHYGQLMRDGGLASDMMIDLQLAQRLSLSMVWMVYGGAMLAIGIWRRNRMLRIMALALLSITIVKVFAFDLSSLAKLYRIISFIVLGLILLGVSFLYQRLRHWMGDAVDTETQAAADS